MPASGEDISLKAPDIDGIEMRITAVEEVEADRQINAGIGVEDKLDAGIEIHIIAL